VFIGLYRALTNAAGDGLLTEGFFWIPSLGGPASTADNLAGKGLAWLFPLVDGHPPIGWHDALSYLVLPVLLIISQFASQKIMSPQQSTDPSQAQANAILKFLPFMIGWFSLNVPAGLTLYWIVNNVITTTQTVYLRSSVASASAAGGAATPASKTVVNSLPSNPPRLEQRRAVEAGARNGVIDVEVVDRSSSRGSGEAPGARFAQLKASEKAKPKRRAGSSSSGNITWSSPQQAEGEAANGEDRD
jgi:YidC/Oxa1 family membrane protein insertase